MMLADILAATRSRIAPLIGREDDLIRQAHESAPPPSFRAALEGEGMAVIAEVKRRSPSRGELAADLHPPTQAARYAAGGAVALSVLTEPEFFGGSASDLTAVSLATGVPVLRKDFILEPVQVWEARAIGASGVLLIVAALDDDRLVHLLEVADDAGLDALVEVHSPEEADRAVEVGATIVGVNNRDLNDFTVDLGTAEKAATRLEGVPVTVAESGIFTRADTERMAAAGYDAVLVGEALVRADDPAALVRDLRSAG